MSLEEEFKDFLKSSSIFRTFDYGDKSKMMVNKVEYNNKLDILYVLYNYSSNLFDLKTPFKYGGIYDKENDKLYDLDYSLRSNILKWDYDSYKFISIDKLYSVINKDMNNRIKELIDDAKKEIFDISQVEIGNEIEDRDVINDFMDGKTSENLEDSYKQYDTSNSQDLLDYLTDKKSFIEEEGRWFIIENTTDILRSLAITAKKREILKRIEENKEHPYHKIKDIIDAIKNNNCVTVNLTINKDGIEQTFKYNADALKNGFSSSYLSTWHFEKAKERDLFEETFGRSTDLYYEDIVKITYGKNTIYEDENFKEKTLEEENVLEG